MISILGVYGKFAVCKGTQNECIVFALWSTFICLFVECSNTNKLDLINCNQLQRSWTEFFYSFKIQTWNSSVTLRTDDLIQPVLMTVNQQAFIYEREFNKTQHNEFHTKQFKTHHFIMIMLFDMSNYKCMM